MSAYKNILVAVDFSAVADRVMARAKQLADQYQARLSLVHVVEYIPPLEPVGDMMLGIDWGVDEGALVDVSKERLGQLVKKQGLADIPHEVLVGNTRSEITRYAREMGCDLIVIGSHGRRGLSRLLGSTAEAVLHRAHCDVLAVRAEEEG